MLAGYASTAAVSTASPTPAVPARYSRSRTTLPLADSTCARRCPEVGGVRVKASPIMVGGGSLHKPASLVSGGVDGLLTLLTLYGGVEGTVGSLAVHHKHDDKHSGR